MNLLILWFITALALSVDGFTAGFSLGLRKIHVGNPAKIAITLFSAGFAAAAIGAGELLAKWLPARFGSLLGGMVLVLLGISGIHRAIAPAANPKKSPSFEQFHLLGLPILILRDPIQGDLDHSGSIDCKEALLFGVSLSIDMLGAGFGLALGDHSNWWGLPLLVCALQTGFLSLGCRLGRQMTKFPIRKKTCEITAGALLLLLGITRLFF